MKTETQSLLLEVLLPRLRRLKFDVEQTKSNYWDVKRRWQRTIDHGIKSTRSLAKKMELRDKKFEDDTTYVDWKVRFDKSEAEFSEFWNALIDAGFEIPADWNERK